MYKLDITKVLILQGTEGSHDLKKMWSNYAQMKQNYAYERGSEVSYFLFV